VQQADIPLPKSGLHPVARSRVINVEISRPGQPPPPLVFNSTRISYPRYFRFVLAAMLVCDVLRRVSTSLSPEVDDDVETVRLASPLATMWVGLARWRFACRWRRLYRDRAMNSSRTDLRLPSTISAHKTMSQRKNTKLLFADFRHKFLTALDRLAFCYLRSRIFRLFFRQRLFSVPIFWTRKAAAKRYSVALVLVVISSLKIPKAFLTLTKLCVHIRAHILYRSAVSDF